MFNIKSFIGVITSITLASTFLIPVNADINVPVINREDDRVWAEQVGGNAAGAANTADKIRTSNTYYRTVAVTVTRCVPGTQIPTGEKYTANLNLFTTTQSNGVEYNTIGTSYADFLANASASWQAEYQSYVNGTASGEYYIKFDCIMAVCENGHWLTNPDGSLKTFYDYNSIANAEPWANKTGLLSHFNKFIPIRKTKKAQALLDAQPLSGAAATQNEYDYDIGHHETAPIEYREGNSSIHNPPYDIGTGIPTTEYLKNEYEATRWWAKTNVRVKVKFWDEYDRKVSYQFPYWDGKSYYTKIEVYYDATGRHEHEVEDRSRPKWYMAAWRYGPNKISFRDPQEGQPWKMIPIVAYQYLANAQCLDLTSAEVRNKTFENGRVSVGLSVLKFHGEKR